MKHSLYGKQKSLLILFVSIFIFYGFNTIYEWGKENFKQAERHDEDFVKEAKKYLRSVTAYNSLTAEAEFHTMLLSDDARMLYVDYYAKIHGLNQEQIKVLKQRQIHENRNFISMYVVAWKRDREYVTSRSLFTGESLKTGNILKGEDALWNVTLVVGGKRYQPEAVRLVDMPIEYQIFFGNHYNIFSTVYLVRFAAKDNEAKFIFPQEKCTAVIDFNSPRYRVKTVYKGINFYLKN